jgi:hypothetical protein
MRSAGAIGIFVIAVLVWLRLCDWYFDSSPEGLLLRTEGGILALVEDAGASLFTPAILAFALWERLIPNATTIDRSPLFLFSVLQLLPYGCLCLARLRRSTRFRRCVVGYAFGCVFLIVVGFIYLHWTIRPAITRLHALGNGANKTVVDNRLPAPSSNDPLDYNP